VYTGRLDQFFDYKYGVLGWRSLNFEREVHEVRDFQGTAVMNYAEGSIPYTRSHEFKHLHEEREYDGERTLVFREYPRDLGDGDDPYYPMNTAKDSEMYQKYQEEVQKTQNVSFGGRLAEYRYLNMDQTIASALKTYDEKMKSR
jgi:UDP-galactopyranose mutase